MSKSRRKSGFRDKVSSDTQRQKSRGSQFSYLDLPEGVLQFNEIPGSSIELDFLPYEVTDGHHPDRNEDDEVAIKGSLWYKRPFKVHRNVGAGDQSRTIVCPSSFGEPCPICEYRAEKRKGGADPEELRGMNYSFRNLYIVVPVNVGEYDKYKDLKEGQFYIWDIAQGNFQKALNEDLQEDPDYGVFPDLEEGLTLKIRFSAEEIFKVEYAKTSKIRYLERDKPYKEDILDEVPNLDEVLKVLPYKEIDTLFLHGEGPDREDEPEEEPLSRRGRREYKQEPEEDEEKPRRERKDKKEEKEDECPAGHTFGKDYDKFKDCDECKVWEPCSKAKDEE